MRHWQNTKPLTTFERLAERLRQDFGFEVLEFRRVRSGYWQRAAGGWSWMAKEGNHIIGSPYSAGDLLKAKKLVLFHPHCCDTEVLPE